MSWPHYPFHCRHHFCLLKWNTRPYLDTLVQERHNSIVNTLEFLLSCSQCKERHNSIANALELCLSCINPLSCCVDVNKHQCRPMNSPFNSLRPRQNGRRFADDTFKRILLNENVRTSIKISLKFVPKGPINNNLALVQIMAWRLSGDKP